MRSSLGLWLLAAALGLGCLAGTLPARAQPAASGVTVFASGTEGYATFRIPAIVEATNGMLLAFAEGRKGGAADTGDIDLVLKRSADGGLTWGPLILVADNGPNTCGNPVPIVDAPSGRVVLLTTQNRGNVAEWQILQGKVEDRRVYVQESADCGATWTAPREITVEAKRRDWRCYATGPGHGIQLRRGPHAGRLVAPCDHSTSAANDWSACGAHLLLSDDGGRTWRIGAVDEPGTGQVNPNETTAVELTGGEILAVTRNQEGKLPGHRAAARSRDGGVTFAAPFALEPSLVSPVVEGALLRAAAVDQGDPTNRLLFSAPGDPIKRQRMTVWSSFDEGRTWDSGHLVNPGASAYSDMVRLAGGKIGLLYETGARNPYERIVFQVLSPALLDGAGPPGR